MLQTQLDLTHSRVYSGLIRDMIDRKEAALSKFEHLVATPEASLMDTLTTATSATQSLYAKKLPSSTYKGSKNVSSFNYNIFRQDILQRIRVFAENAETSRRKELECHLTNCFNISVGTENSTCYDAWFKLMRTLEAVDLEVKNDVRHNFSSDSDVQTAHHSISNITERFLSLTDEAKASLEGEDLLQTLQEISRVQRLLLKKVEDRTLLETMGELWTLVCQLFDISVSLNDTKIKRAYSDIQHQVDEERLRIKSSLRLMADSWQSRLDDSKKQTIKAHTMIERLQKEKSFVSELLKERESEINEIRRPEGIKDFENVMGELALHLEEMETRHETTSQLLDSISELINTRNIRKHTKRKDELGHLLVKNAIAGRGEGGGTQVARMESLVSKGESTGREDAVVRSSANSGKNETESIKLVRGGSLETTGGTEAARLRSLSIGHYLVKQIRQKQPSYTTPPSNVLNHSVPCPDHPPKLPHPPIPQSVDDYTATVMNASDADSSSDSEETTDEKGVQTEAWHEGDMVTQQTTQTEFGGRRGKNLGKKTGLFALLDDEMKRQPPMLSSNVFKLFEIAMFEKLKSDMSEEQLGRPQKSMSEFMLDFLFMQQGLKTLVMKSLGALLNALEVLAMKQHPYGLLFCRVLNVFADRPFDNLLNSFLVKARAEFADLQKGYKAMNSKTEIEYGGNALLVDISERLISLFPQHKSIAYEIIERLPIPGLTDFDKSCVIFCGRLAKVGRDFKIFFIQADPQKTGVVDESGFLMCAQEAFEICLNADRLLEIYHYLTQGKLHFADIQKLPFKDWALKAQNRSVSITKCTFLSVIAEVYWMEEERLQEKLKLAYDRNCQAGLASLSDFQRLILDLEPQTAPEVAVHLYREALELSSETCDNPDLVTKEAFCEIGLKYRLGCEGLKAFSGSGVPPMQYALDLEASQKFLEETE